VTSSDHEDPIMQFSQLFVPFALSGPNIFPSPVFLNSLSLCSSASVRHKGSYPHKQRKGYGSVYFILCVFGCQSGRQKILDHIAIGIL